MRAVDTNLLLRLATGDDPVQEQTVRRLLDRERLFVTLTVTMECEWVLRSFYKLGRRERADAILALLLLDNLVFERPDLVRWACGRLAAGAKFDDLIHVAAASLGEADAFVTFDAGVAKSAGPDAPIRVDHLR